MADERLDGKTAEAFLAGAIALAREAAVSPTWFEPSVRALEVAFGERPLQPAPTLAFDLTALLSGERLAPVPAPAVGEVRDALRAWEDHVLARLTGDRRWTRLTEALTAAPRALRPAAVGMTVSQVLQRLGVVGGTGVSTAVVRRFATRPIDEVLEAGRAALWDPAVGHRLAAGLADLARAARRTRDLLSDAEVFLVENIAALKGLGPRVALAQLAEVAQAVDERLPARLRSHAFDDGQAPTRLEEDSAFPVGGFASLSTSGTLENLVTSELIYMEPGAAPEDRPDLFDVRFVEGELLYYSRDESVAVRRRRTLVLIFDASLKQARVLDAAEAYQRLVWALGSVTALVRKLSAWMSQEALRFELVFVTEAGEAPLDEERSMLGLLLREFRARGQLSLTEAASAEEAVLRARALRAHRVRVVLFSARAAPAQAGPTAPDLTIDLTGPRPVVRGPDASAGGAEPPRDALTAWVQATGALLDGLLGRRRGRAAPAVAPTPGRIP